MRYVQVWSSIVMLWVPLVAYAIDSCDIVLAIIPERVGFEKRVILQEFREVLKSMKTQDRFVVTKVINFLYGDKDTNEIEDIGFRGTVFLLCKAEKLLLFYKSLFNNEQIYKKLLDDIKNKKSIIEHQE